MKLQRTAQLITSTLDLDTLIHRVVHDLGTAIGGNIEVSVWLLNEDSDEMVLQGVCGCTLHAKGARMRVGHRGMVGHVAATGRMHYAKDVSLDPYYIACEPETRSEVAIPLLSGGRVIGVLSADHRQVDGFSPDQLQILQAMAGHIGVGIQHAREFEAERVQRQRMEYEAGEARRIQEALVPRAFPLVPGFVFEAEWRPAGAVAGDWFDFIDLGDGRTGVVLGDVSGKGIPAALVMSASRAALRGIAKTQPSPAQALAQLNAVLTEDLPSGKFVTLLYGVLDPTRGEITLASAGHPRPLLIENRDCRFVEMDNGMPLGLGASSFPEHTLRLSPGSRLVFYSDGITEAMNRDYEEFGGLRLMEHFRNPHACAEALIDEVRRYGHGSDLTDDATVVVIQARG
jgi:sigma-B regulation protein RsbU (phosphoserine phosphatase)